jgi:anti-sigma-K factor RskA
MNHGASEDESIALAALYSLGALNQPEASMFEQHIAGGCELCVTELRSFEGVVANLAFDSSEQEPPWSVRERLLSNLKQFSEPVPSHFRARRISVATTHRSLPWAVAASVALLAIVSIANFRGIITSREAELVRLTAELRQQKESVDQLRQINDAQSSPGSRAIVLPGQPPVANSSAKIYLDTRNNLWVVTTDMPPPPEGKVYQLWLVTKTAKISAGLIRQAATGQGFLAVKLPASMNEVIAAAITLEPEGGSPQPTMPLYAVANLGS